ncbi:MAG: hypothetical protein WA809_07155 [Candidatus Dormiibacterota bacterium]
MQMAPDLPARARTLCLPDEFLEATPKRRRWQGRSAARDRYR